MDYVWVEAKDGGEDEAGRGKTDVNGAREETDCRACVFKVNLILYAFSFILRNNMEAYFWKTLCHNFFHLLFFHLHPFCSKSFRRKKKKRNYNIHTKHNH